MNYECVIFDLDGVLVDTAKYHFLAWKKIAHELGIHLSESDNDKLKGVSRSECIDIIISLDKSDIMFSQEEKFDLTNCKNEIYLSYINNLNESEVLPGAIPLLEFLQKRNYKVALGSASKNARAILDKVGIKKYFDFIVDGNMVSENKPNPEVFLLSAEKLKIDSQKCIVFEDSIAGIQAGNKAGMFTIGVGSREKLKEAKIVVESVKEFDPNSLHH